MEEVFVNKDLAYIYTKLLLTIQSYKNRFPELEYINTAIDTIVENKLVYDIEVFDALNSYLKDALHPYYVIRIIQHRFELDIKAIKAGIAIEQKKGLYLEFAI